MKKIVLFLAASLFLSGCLTLEQCWQAVLMMYPDAQKVEDCVPDSDRYAGLCGENGAASFFLIRIGIEKYWYYHSVAVSKKGDEPTIKSVYSDKVVFSAPRSDCTGDGGQVSFSDTIEKYDNESEETNETDIINNIELNFN